MIHLCFLLRFPFVSPSLTSSLFSSRFVFVILYLSIRVICQSFILGLAFSWSYEVFFWEMMSTIYICMLMVSNWYDYWLTLWFLRFFIVVECTATVCESGEGQITSCRLERGSFKNPQCVWSHGWTSSSCMSLYMPVMMRLPYSLRSWLPKR